MNYDCFYFLLHLRYIDDNRNTQKQKKRITIKCQHMTFDRNQYNTCFSYHYKFQSNKERYQFFNCFTIIVGLIRHEKIA